jgi:hypothetical protein
MTPEHVQTPYQGTIGARTGETRRVSIAKSLLSAPDSLSSQPGKGGKPHRKGALLIHCLANYSVTGM